GEEVSAYLTPVPPAATVSDGSLNLPSFAATPLRRVTSRVGEGPARSPPKRRTSRRRTLPHGNRRPRRGAARQVPIPDSPKRRSREGEVDERRRAEYLVASRIGRRFRS